MTNISKNTETYILEPRATRGTFFGHLMYGSPTDKVGKMVDDPAYSGDALEVRLEINGHTLRVEDFNKILDDWEARIIEHVKDDIKAHDVQHRVKFVAMEMINKIMEDMDDEIFYGDEE